MRVLSAPHIVVLESGWTAFSDAWRGTRDGTRQVLATPHRVRHSGGTRNEALEDLREFYHLMLWASPRGNRDRSRRLVQVPPVPIRLGVSSRFKIQTKKYGDTVSLGEKDARPSSCPWPKNYGCHILIVRSFDPDATAAPHGDASTQKTPSKCPGSVPKPAANLRVFVVTFFASDPGTPSSAALQTFNVESLDAETTNRESGAQARAYTAPTWPARVAKKSPRPPVPQFDLLVEGGRRELPRVRTEENRIDGLLMPVRRALGFVFAAPAFSDVQNNKVASSEPLTNLSHVAGPPFAFTKAP